jgi:hypothetical protein
MSQTSVFYNFGNRFRKAQECIEEKFSEAEADRHKSFKKAEGERDEKNDQFEAQEANLEERFQAAMAWHSEYFEEQQRTRSGGEEGRRQLFENAEEQRSCAFNVLKSRDMERYSATDVLETEIAKFIQNRIARILDIQQDSLDRLEMRRSTLFAQSQARRAEQLKALFPSSSPPFEPTEGPSHRHRVPTTVPHPPTIVRMGPGERRSKESPVHRPPQIVETGRLPSAPLHRRDSRNYIGLVRSLTNTRVVLIPKFVFAGPAKSLGTSKSERSIAHP